MSTVIVRMTVKADCVDAFAAILRDVSSNVPIHEPDCLIYSTWRTDQPNVFVMVESYRSEAGRALHNARYAELFPKFIALLDGPPTTEVLGDLLAGVPE
jgi:quinol monooxygenase YgiN